MRKLRHQSRGRNVPRITNSKKGHGGAKIATSKLRTRRCEITTTKKRPRRYENCDLEEETVAFRENYDLKVDAVELGSGDIEAEALTLRKLRTQSRIPNVAKIKTSK